MEMGGMILLMGAIMKDNGARTKLTVQERFTSKMVSLSIKDNGGMTYIMVGELYTLKIRIGPNMKGSSKME